MQKAPVGLTEFEQDLACAISRVAKLKAVLAQPHSPTRSRELVALIGPQHDRLPLILYGASPVFGSCTDAILDRVLKELSDVADWPHYVEAARRGWKWRSSYGPVPVKADGTGSVYCMDSEYVYLVDKSGVTRQWATGFGGGNVYFADNPVPIMSQNTIYLAGWSSLLAVELIDPSKSR